MATLSSTRIGTSLTWSLQFATRSRSLALSFTLTERARLRRHPSHRNDRDRYFSTQPSRRQEPETTPSSYVRKTPNLAAPSSFVRPATNPTFRSRAAPSAPAARQPPPETSRNVAANPPQEPIRELATEGLSDLPPVAPSAPADVNPEQVDWARSFHGLSSQSFSKEAQEILMSPIPIDDIEIKPDGILYLPEIKYRRILNRAFGPGGWGLAPRGETVVTAKCVTREYALLANGRLVSIARGEQDYFDTEGIPTATEGCKSNALMRCCKDLGVASELWDPRYIRRYMAEHAKEIWVEHLVTKKKKKMTMRKDDELRYPYKEVRGGASGAFA